MSLLDVLSSVLLLSGASFCLIGAVGLLRFADVPSRLQAATKPQTLGLGAILLGAALQLELRFAVGLLLVALLQLVTAPVIAQRVGRAAYRTGRFRADLLVVDELAAGRHSASDDPVNPVDPSGPAPAAPPS